MATASASRDLKAQVTDVVTCPICQELFISPKSLPCLHTFCLRCIEDYCRDKRPGVDAMSCPVCRLQFKIPASGVRGLVGNFLIADLLEARKRASDVTASAAAVPCEMCSALSGEDRDGVAASTAYCVDCDQTLCDGCCRRHRMWNREPHNEVPMWNEAVMDGIQALCVKCDKHTTDDAILYCLDCKLGVCVNCFTEEHQQHKCYYVGAEAARRVEQVDADMELVKGKAEAARNEISRLVEEGRKFVSVVEEVREKIVARGEELKQLIDKQVNELVAEVRSFETEQCKEIGSLREKVESKLSSFETFSAQCSELKAEGEACGITRAANDLHIKAIGLLKTDVTPTDYSAPAVTFKPMNIHTLLPVGQNFIGVVNPKELLVVHSLHTFPEAQPVWGVTSLDDELYVLRRKGDKNKIEVYKTTTTAAAAAAETTEPYSFVREMSVPGLRPNDMTSCKHYRCLYISNSGNHNGHVLRVKLNGKVISQWLVRYCSERLSVTSQFTLLVSCSDPAAFCEFTTDGKKLREIDLRPHIPHPAHVIQLSNGQFIVCCGDATDPVNRLCAVDANGHVTQSYGGLRGSAAVGQLYGPAHMAVDSDGSVYVADFFNRRVLLLSPTLSFVREIVSSAQLTWQPMRLFLDVDGRRLYVSDGEYIGSGRIVVVQL